MRFIFCILFLSIQVIVSAQSKEQIAVLAQTGTLHSTVFGTKDSLTLEGLFWKELTYGHSNGKVETRKEAIKNIIHNKSNYIEDYSHLKNYNVTMNDAKNAAVVRYAFKAVEKKDDGTESQLYLGIMLVWIKEKGKWLLLARQAIKIQ